MVYDLAWTLIRALSAHAFELQSLLAAEGQGGGRPQARNGRVMSLKDGGRL